jgi:uroporphyrinogen III methyltransferase/synthase
VVVTRAREQADPLARALRERGARVIEAPAIALGPPRSWGPADRAIRRLARYRYVIFTSANGVARFFARLAEIGADVRALAGADVIAIGPATAAALAVRGLVAAAVPEEYRAEAIVALLRRRPLARVRVLIPRAAVARDLLARELRRRGARVDVVPVYRTRPSPEGVTEVSEALRRGGIDLLTFTSSSTVEQFARKFRAAGDGRRLRAVPAAAIGPITAATARRHGFRVAVMPRAYTIPALAEAIARRFRNSPSGTPRGT